MAGHFISFEGGEGVGKSTQINQLEIYLSKTQTPYIRTREPGGTLSAELIRDMLLNGEHALNTQTQTLLFAAARLDHVSQVIKPALLQNKWVICDRYIDSTRVYQGGGLSTTFIDLMEGIATQGIMPEITFILDLSAEKVVERLHQRHQLGQAADNFENVNASIHAQRRQAFLDIAKKEPKRCYVIDASQDIATIAAEIQRVIKERIR